MAIGLLPIVLGEAPVQYGVPALASFPSSGLSGGYYAGGGSSGGHSHEGLNVDPELLHKIKSILIDHEDQEDQHRQHQYLPPPVYGVPHHQHHYNQGRVSGIHFGGIRPSIQVAQFHKVDHEYSAGGHEHHSYAYAAPAVHYAAPAVHYAAPAVHYSAPSHGYSAPSAPAFLVAPRPQLAYGPPPSPRYTHQ